MPRSTQNPLHLYPESPQKLHPNVQLNAPAPRIEKQKFLFDKTKREKQTGLPTISKWQIGLFLWQKVARRDAQRAQQGRKPCTGRSRGAAPGAPLVTFPATGKSPGCRAERLHQGTLGLPAPHKVGRGAGRSARSLRVWELCSHIGECRGGPQAAPRIGVAGAYFPCASIRSARSLR